MHRAVTGALALALSSVVLVAARAAGDAPPAIAIGEIAAPATTSRELVVGLLETELQGRDDVRLASSARRARYVLRGSVVHLEQRGVADGIEVRCEISLIVSEARGGAIRALLSGRAGARGVDDPERLARAALEGAVHGALRPLGDRLR